MARNGPLQLRALNLSRIKGSSSRLTGALADQMLSSATNFALGFVIARTQGPVDFGAFNLAFAAYIIALGSTRSVNTDPLMIRYSATSAERWRKGTSAAIGAAITTGIVVGLICIGVGAAIPGVTRTCLVAMGVAMPGLLLQDSWRMAFFSKGQPSKAVLNDAAWVGVMAIALAALHATDNLALLPLMSAWGGAAAIAALVGFLQAPGCRPHLNPLPWWREHRDLGPRFLAEFGATGALQQLTMYTIGLIAGLIAVGQISAALLVLGPFTILVQGGTAFGISEGARVLKRSAHALFRATNLFGALLAAAAAAWGTLAWMVPASLGSSILGSSWAAGRSVLIPTTVYMVASGFGVGTNVGLRAIEAARESLRTKVVLGVLILVGGTAGAWVAGAKGAAWGMATANIIGMWLRWWVFRRVTVEHDADLSSAITETA